MNLNDYGFTPDLLPEDAQGVPARRLPYAMGQPGLPGDRQLFALCHGRFLSPAPGPAHGMKITFILSHLPGEKQQKCEKEL